MKKVKSENFVLADYKRSIPKSKKLVSQDTITLITNYLQSNSRNSTVTTNQNIPIYLIVTGACGIASILLTIAIVRYDFLKMINLI